LCHKNEKKAYNARIAQAVVTPLVFGSNGAMGKECATYHKMLASKLAAKYKLNK
jgi:hypothetical protein